MARSTISREHKKLFLFLSRDNKFWQSVEKISRHPEQKEIAYAIGVSEPSLAGWKDSWAISNDITASIMENLRHLALDGEVEIKPRSKRNSPAKSSYIVKLRDKAEGKRLFCAFEKSYRSNDNVYSTAKAMELSLDASQRILDEVFYHRAPLLPGMYYYDEDDAKNAITEYGGVYLMWLRRDEQWLQCPLRVRYILQLRKLPTIRCKLNIPYTDRYDEEVRTYWEYDGFLADNGHGPNYWVFESRIKGQYYDQFYMITREKFSGTSHRDSRKLATMLGKYLTTDQDGPRSITTGELFMQRQLLSTRTREHEEQEIQLMHTEARQLPADKAKAAATHHGLLEVEERRARRPKSQRDQPRLAID